MVHRIFPKNIADLYQQAAVQFGNRPAVAARRNGGSYVTISYKELFEVGRNLATALIALGLEPREHIGIIAGNRAEWIFVDCAIQLLAATNVPRGTESTVREVKYVLNHSGARFVFVENARVLKRFQSCLPDEARVIVMDSEPGKEHAAGDANFYLQDLIARGATLRQAGDRNVEERIARIQSDDVFTLIYTSGTTGIPKGVPLTHANAVSQIRNLPFPLHADDRSLSILPVWHSYERVFELITLSWGVVIYYTYLRSIASDLKTVKPTVMCSAPRLWESLYRKIHANLSHMPAFQRGLFHIAYGAARKVKTAEFFFRGDLLDVKGRSWRETTRLGLVFAVQWLLCFPVYYFLDKIILKKVRDMVGGKFRGTISGGGALQSHVDEFFNFIGIPILEGYGLTETSPVLAVRTWKKLVIGTVGPLYPETEIRIIDLDTGELLYPNLSRPDRGRGRIGEIHARGPQIMKGYYRDEAATASVLQDGWLNTGDIGLMTFNNCLKIIGRSKDTIVLISGENVEPLPIESLLLHSPLIEQCMVVGQDQKFLGALIVPSLEGFAAIGISKNSIKELATHPQVTKMLETEIRRLIHSENGFKPFEHIVRWRIISKMFEPGDDLTQTFKLKRYIIAEKYAHIIQEMFRADGAKFL